MKATKSEAYWAAVKSDFRVFLRHCFGTLYPGSQYLDNWHIHAIVYALEQCIQGKNPRLIINLPPRHLKSFITSIVLPAFILGLDPTTKIICISYSDDLARALARDFKRIVENTWFRGLFPNVSFIKTTENEFVTSAGGGRYATSIGGTLTGRGGDFIIIDDPMKAEDANHDKTREATNDWYRNSLLSRLDDKTKSVLIIVMQRLHVNDLTGFAEASGGFNKLAFPAIALRDESIPLGDEEAHERVKGEPLHAERDGLDVLKRIRDEIRPHVFNAQYQQRPDVPDGTFFKRKYIKLVADPRSVPPGGQYWISIDPAASTSITADFTAICLIYTVNRCYYVLYAERGRWDYEALLAKARSYAKAYPQATFIIENASTGISLIQSLAKNQIRYLSYRPKPDKLTRAAYVLPIFEEGRVHVLNQPEKNAWVEPFINEIVSFPSAPFNDQVDSLVQALMCTERRVNPQSRIFFY